MAEHHDLDLDDPRLEGWAERWRYPYLLAELERQAAEGVSRGGEQVAAQAWLRDIAQPPRDLPDVLQALVARGQLAAAARLVADGALLEREGVDRVRATEAVEAARATDQHERQRRELALAVRAEAARVTVSHEPGADPVAAQVSDGEQRRRDEVLQRLSAAGFDDEEFRALVSSALDAREFAAAEQLIDAGPTEEVVGGPALVRLPRPWPYREPTPTVLSWFDDATAGPRDFDRRRPPADDDPGLAVVAAVRAAWAELDATTARDLAEALDGMLVDGPFRHRPEPADGGFRVRAYGLSDPRLPWLGLRDRVVLTIGPRAPEPTAAPAVWLALAEPDPTVRIANVAVITPRDLLEIVSPTSGKAGTPHHRRINLLRVLCRSLDAAAVVGQNPGDLGDGAEMREAITWMLDMLGLRAQDPALPDVVLHDAARLPAAVCAIVRELGERNARPGDLTLADLGALRADRAAVRRIRTAVTAPLGDDANALVVLGALLLSRPELGTGIVDPAAATAELAELAESPGGLDHVDVADAVRRLNAVGLVRVLEPADDGRVRVRICGPGLAALLTDDGLWTETQQQLAQLQRLAEDRKRAARIAVESQTSHSYRHLYDNYVFISTQLGLELARTDLAVEDRIRVGNRLQRVSERIATLHLAQQGRIDELAARDFDLTTTLDEFSRLHTYDGAPAALEVGKHAELPPTLPVRGIEELVLLALDDLLVNAHRAMERAGSPDRRILVTVAVLDRAVEQVAVVDVEDSGPGFGTLTGPDDERARAGLRGGDGLANATLALQTCRGELERVPDPSALGGAHVRVVLPLTS